MKFKTFDGESEIGLLPCPFCGSDPIVSHIGNNHTKKRSIEIKCPCCRIHRKDSTLRFGFMWLELSAAKNWNRRVF